MCMFEMCDPTDVCSTSEHTSRKLYRCSECGMVIHPGERYQRAFTVNHGEKPTTHFMCESCFPVRDWLLDQCGGYVFGSVMEDLTDHWHYHTALRTWNLGRMIVSIVHRYKMARMMKNGHEPRKSR